MKRWGKYISPAIGLVMLILAIVALREALDEHSYQDIVRALQAIPMAKLALAVGLTALSYLILTMYDFLGLWYVGRRLHALKTMMTSFIAYSFGYTIGLSAVSGTSVRYRLYSTWSLSLGDIAKIAIFCGATAWVGFLFLGGTAFILGPNTTLANVSLPQAPRLAGFAALALVGIYLLATCLLRRRYHIRGVVVSLPRPALAGAQVAVASTDLAIAGAALYVLLPQDSGISYISFMGVFFIALSMGILSQVPGGLGVIEVVVVQLLRPVVPIDSIMGALLAFRVIYYLLPFAGATILFASFEAYQGRTFLARATDARKPAADE